MTEYFLALLPILTLPFDRLTLKLPHRAQSVASLFPNAVANLDHDKNLERANLALLPSSRAARSRHSKAATCEQIAPETIPRPPTGCFQEITESEKHRHHPSTDEDVSSFMENHWPQICFKDELAANLLQGRPDRIYSYRRESRKRAQK